MDVPMNDKEIISVLQCLKADLLSAISNLTSKTPMCDVLMQRYNAVDTVIGLLVNKGYTKPVGHWICSYDPIYRKTDVTCSSCGDTRTINGCYVSTTGESIYFEDDFCPRCGMDMSGR